MMIKGRAWVFGDDVSTDDIAPSVYLTQYLSPEKLKEIAMEGIEPGFYKKFKAGDLMVAGRNFGCGSSREEAPMALKSLGVAAVVAESFGRIFYRNSINVGLAVVACPGISEQVKTGDSITVNIETGEVVIEKTGMRLKGEEKPQFLLDILRKGGLLEHLRQTVL
ncbi:MAG: 3-isopropylmalate dehydratase small subunit [Deltaproteobacteria bacterium]|nr:3-isopropylmalate dehydratase small subunit [Deltaproteobacteria bacterium]